MLQINNSQLIFKGRSVSDLSADNFILANNAEPVALPANANPVIASPVTDGDGDTDQGFTVNLLEGASDPDGFDTVQVSGLTLVSDDASGVTENGDSLIVDPLA